MVLGRRKEAPVALFVATAQRRPGSGHPFCRKLKEVLARAGFGAFVEGVCARSCREGGRPGLPPGVCFRLRFLGCFEGVDRQRGLAWRGADRLALRSFPGLAPPEPTPVHAAMSGLRQRLPETLFDEVCNWVFGRLDQPGRLPGKTLGVDAATLEAKAAVQSLVRKDTGQGRRESGLPPRRIGHGGTGLERSRKCPTDTGQAPGIRQPAWPG